MIRLAPWLSAGTGETTVAEKEGGPGSALACAAILFSSAPSSVLRSSLLARRPRCYMIRSRMHPGMQSARQACIARHSGRQVKGRTGQPTEWHTG